MIGVIRKIMIFAEKNESRERAIQVLILHTDHNNISIQNIIRRLIV